MKRIDISTPKYPSTFALVDDEDYEWLNQWKWYAVPGRKTFYAARQIRTKAGRGGQRIVFMHRMILGLERIDQTESDHKNGNGLDNQRQNVRKATRVQNCRNRSGRQNTKSKYKGVVGRSNKWRARITVEHKQFHLGYFRTEFAAAKAYDKKAKELFGEFARLNTI